MKHFMRKDRDAIARVRHDTEFLSQRRGMLAVAIDLDDATRLLALIERLGGDVERMEAELAKRARSGTCQVRCQVSGLQR